MLTFRLFGKTVKMRIILYFISFLMSALIGNNLLQSRFVIAAIAAIVISFLKFVGRCTVFVSGICPDGFSFEVWIVFFNTNNDRKQVGLILITSGRVSGSITLGGTELFFVR